MGSVSRDELASRCVLPSARVVPRVPIHHVAGTPFCVCTRLSRSIKESGWAPRAPGGLCGCTTLRTPTPTWTHRYPRTRVAGDPCLRAGPTCLRTHSSDALGPCLSISSRRHAQGHRAVLAVSCVGLFTPRESANATHQGLFYLFIYFLVREVVAEH